MPTYGPNGELLILLTGAGVLLDHEHSAPGDGGPLAVGVTDTDLTAGHIWFTGAGGVLDEDADIFWNNATKHLGIGTNAPGDAHVYIVDTTLTSTATFYGVRSEHIKTGGAGGVGDDYYGVDSWMELNQATTIDNLLAVNARGKLTLGTADLLIGGFFVAEIDGGTVNARASGFEGSANIDGGTVEDVYGVRIGVDIEAAATINGDVFGAWIQVDDDAGAAGTVYGLYIDQVTGVDYCIYVDGSADNYIGGSVGVGVTVPLSKVHIDQAAAGGAIPVLTLDQADVDYVLAKIIATAAAASADRTLVADSDFGTPGALVGWIQIEIQDDGNRVADGDYYIPFYAAPT